MGDIGFFNTARKIVNGFSSGLFITIVGLVTTINDLPISGKPVFFYEFKILGLDPLDWLTLGLCVLILIYFIMQKEVIVTSFHRYLVIVVVIYIVAMITGFVYGIFFDYSLKRWVQDFQPIIYALIFFIVSFELLNTKARWRLFLKYLFVLVVIKGIHLAVVFLTSREAMLQLGARGIIAFGTDLVLLTIMYYLPLAILFYARKMHYVKRIFAILIMILFVLITVINTGRTTWVLFLLSTIYFVYELKPVSRIKFLSLVLVIIALTFGYLQTKQPKFITVATWQLGSAVNLTISQENLSNATRICEIKNVVHRLLSHASLIQGMGLGAWWDDEAYRLPPYDYGSGFIGHKRYVHTHLLFLTQLLKIGLIGTIIYWIIIFKMFVANRRAFKKLADDHPDKPVLLALNIIFLNLALCMAFYLRIFIFLGLILGLIARVTLFIEEREGEQ